MATDASQEQPREFEVRRAEIVGQIGEVDIKSLEQVLAQINTLNRSLEGIIEIGNEFASVEALWSQFETVMGREDNAGAGASSNNTVNDGALGESSAHGNHR